MGACNGRVRIALWLILLGAMVCVRAELVVVVNSQSGVEELTRAQVVNIFLGHTRELPNGSTAYPVDLPFSQPEKTLFYRQLVNKDLDQIAAYWSRLVFAGNTQPPWQAGSVQEALQYIASHKGAVAYMDRRYTDARVKVVFGFP
jgi:hypothetical protein